MCGIAGSVNFTITSEEVKFHMGHRGPDGNGFFQHENVSLAHLRLSILDLTGGSQPMFLANRYAIIFNGEIYNHLEVRKQLQLTCYTHSDTETILAAYQKVGEKCLSYFDGMFAFCLYDMEEKELFIARDRAGKKPFFFLNDGRKFLFSSELNLMRSWLDADIHTEAMGLYLRMGALWPGHTPYRQVAELEAGTWMKVDTTTLSHKKEKWWTINDPGRQVNNDLILSDALLQTDTLLKKSIERRLESSDLEVGCFLSGGIDSGLVTAIAASYKNQLKTFTVSFNGAFDEAPLSRLVARQYGTNHTEIKISMDGLKTDIEQILSHFGEPFYDSSAIPSWYVSKAAKQYVTVILNGDGADELFAGYRRHLLFSKFNFFKSPGLLKSACALLYPVMPAAHDKKTVYNYLSRLVFLGSRKNAGAVFAAAGSDIFEGFETALLVDPKSCYGPLDELEHWVRQNNGSGLQQLMQLDFNITLFSDFLVKMDMATMAHSLEGRSPFLSKELLEFAPTVPDYLKINGKTTKFLLRKLAEKYLPETLWNQPKRGFEIPLKNWVNNDLKEIIHDYLGSSNAYYPTLVSKNYVERLLDKKVGISEEKRAKQLYTLLSLEVWYKKCYLKGMSS